MRLERQSRRIEGDRQNPPFLCSTIVGKLYELTLTLCGGLNRRKLTFRVWFQVVGGPPAAPKPGPRFEKLYDGVWAVCQSATPANYILRWRDFDPRGHGGDRVRRA